MHRISAAFSNGHYCMGKTVDHHLNTFASIFCPVLISQVLHSYIKTHDSESQGLTEASTTK